MRAATISPSKVEAGVPVSTAFIRWEGEFADVPGIRVGGGRGWTVPLLERHFPWRRQGFTCPARLTTLDIQRLSVDRLRVAKEGIVQSGDLLLLVADYHDLTGTVITPTPCYRRGDRIYLSPTCKVCGVAIEDGWHPQDQGEYRTFTPLEAVEGIEVLVSQPNWGGHLLRLKQGAQFRARTYLESRTLFLLVAWKRDEQGPFLHVIRTESDKPYDAVKLRFNEK